jgi:hypothetical protein
MAFTIIPFWAVLFHLSESFSKLVVSSGKGKSKKQYTIINCKIITNQADGATTIQGTLPDGSRAILYWSARNAPKPLKYEMMSHEEMIDLTPDRIEKSDKASQRNKKAEVSAKITEADVLNAENYA